MAITYRAVFTGGDTTGTANRTITLTPAVGDLLIVFCSVSTNTNAAPTCSDGQAIGRGYHRLSTAAWDTSAASMSSVFIANELCHAASSMTITVATGSNTAGAIVVIACSGALRGGLDVVRSWGKQASQASGTTPAPALNQAALTENMTLVATMSADTETAPNASWTERAEHNIATPTTAIEVATRDSGFTGTTITAGDTVTGIFASWAIELDGTAMPLPTVDDFEDGDVSNWLRGTRAVTAQTTTVKLGTYALKAISDNNVLSSAGERLITNTSNTGWFSTYFLVHITTLPGATVTAGLIGWTTAPTISSLAEVYISCTTGGVLTLGNRFYPTPTIIGTPVSINADQWYHLGYRVVCNTATTGVLEVFLDGVLQSGISAYNVDTDISGQRLGYWFLGSRISGPASGQLDMYFDEVVMDTLPYPRLKPVEVLTAVRRAAFH